MARPSASSPPAILVRPQPQTLRLPCRVRTEWHESAADWSLPIGQRVLVTDPSETALMDVRALPLCPADAGRGLNDVRPERTRTAAALAAGPADRQCTRQKRETADQQALTMAQLRQAVLRDLGALLNTTNSATLQDLSATPLAAKSALNYGIPGFAGMTMARPGSTRWSANCAKRSGPLSPGSIPIRYGFACVGRR